MYPILKIIIVIIVAIFVYQIIFINIIKKKLVKHQIKQFERVANFSCPIDNKSSNFKIKLYRVGSKWFIMFYDDIFYQLNEIGSSDIIADYSKPCCVRAKSIFYISVNRLKYNKVIKKYYKDDLIAMSFGDNYRIDIPDFIDEKLGINPK